MYIRLCVSGGIISGDNVFDYVDDKSCMENLFDLLDRFRLSSGEDFK